MVICYCYIVVSGWDCAYCWLIEDHLYLTERRKDECVSIFLVNCFDCCGHFNYIYTHYNKRIVLY